MITPLPKETLIRQDGWRLNPSQVVLLSFTTFMLVGALLLTLPFTHAGPAHNWVDDFFIAASAVCVTGLVPIDPGTSYNTLGQLIILLLIQVGGLGYMVLFTVSMLLIGKRLSMRDRLALQQTTDQPGMTGLVGFLTNIVKFTLAVEGIGFLLLASQLVPQLGWGRGLYFALFDSVSAFNNAGFSLFPEGAVHWQHQPGILLILALLVIVGGLGYTVNTELMRRYMFRLRPQPRWNLLLTTVLSLTAVLLIGGTGMFWLFEHNNPATLAGLPWHEQLANAFFMAVQPRTAGFNSVNVGAMDRPTIMMTILFMFVGGGPGGTAGGIKLTTMAVILAMVFSSVYGQDDINFPGLKRRVSEKIARKSIAVLVLSLALVAVATMLIATLEQHSFLEILFECTSAFGTVGMSMGITGKLGDESKWVLIATMLAGRVGMLTIMMSMFVKRRQSRIRYTEEPLLVG